MGRSAMGCTHSTASDLLAIPTGSNNSSAPLQPSVTHGPTIVKPMELGVPTNLELGIGGRLKSSDGEAIFDNIPDKSRQTSAQSNITTLSVASKGIAYEFNLDDKPAESIVKAHPPRALKKLEMLAEQKLTIEKLLEKQKEAEERKNRVIKENVEKAQNLARPKTAIPSKGRQKHFQEQLEVKLIGAEAKLAQKQEEMSARQRHREEKAKKAKEKFPPFEDRLETDGKEEIPITPVPKMQNSPISKKPSNDAFFD